MMEPRMDIFAVAPDGYKAVMGLETYVRRNLPHDLFELVKLRASMENGCAYCVDMHSTDWLASGEDVRRVVAVSTWHESAFFTDTERAVLALTDQVTRLGEGGVTDEVWDAAEKELGDELLAHVLLAIALINVWNRIAVPTRRQAPALVAG
jgi:AhpD family alkylhydroperoxidase